MKVIDTETKYIAIFNPTQIKYYINDEKLPIYDFGVNSTTNRAYVLFYKDNDTFKAYMKWLERCKNYNKTLQS